MNPGSTRSPLDARIVLRFLDGSRKEPWQQRRFAQPATHRHPLLLPHGGVPRSSQRRRRHAILAIPLKRADTQVRAYLTREEMEAILESIDRTQWRGRRDYALLLTLYNTGARVSEISLSQGQIAFAGRSYVQLHGKGRKDRVVPLWPRTARILKEWFRELGQPTTLRIPHIRGEKLTRFAIHLLLRKTVEQAQTSCPSLKSKRISPHVLRHSTAMALLQSGVDIAVIALWLGHESIETTNEYLHANMAIKENALATSNPSASFADSKPTTPCSNSSPPSDYVNCRARKPAPCSLCISLNIVRL